MLTVVCHHCRSSARITVLQMMANFDNYPWISLRRMAGLALFTFCNNFVQIGNQSAAQPQKIYTICWLTLLLFLTHKPSLLHPSSPLCPTPLPKPSLKILDPVPLSRTDVLLHHSGALPPSRDELKPSTVRCCSPLMRRSPPFNTSLLFSPHVPKSTLQHFAAVLPSRPEVNPSTLRCCSPLTRRSQPFNSSLLPSLYNPTSTFYPLVAVFPSDTHFDLTTSSL